MKCVKIVLNRSSVSVVIPEKKSVAAERSATAVFECRDVPVWKVLAAAQHTWFQRATWTRRARTSQLVPISICCFLYAKRGDHGCRDERVGCTLLAECLCLSPSRRIKFSRTTCLKRWWAALSHTRPTGRSQHLLRGRVRSACTACNCQVSVAFELLVFEQRVFHRFLDCCDIQEGPLAFVFLACVRHSDS